MARNRNSNRSGGAWSETQKSDVWKKGTEISGKDKSTWRKDKCGVTIKWEEHGNRDSENGWEIDHIDPVANGGGDELSNLQPLYWKNNQDKADSLNWKCPS